MTMPDRPDGVVPRNGAKPLAVSAAPALKNGDRPEGMPPKIRIETIHVRACHRGSWACPFCREPMREVTISRERRGAELAVRAEHVAAYRCDRDDYVKPELAAQVEFLAEALARFSCARDSDMVEFLNQELAAAQQIEQQLAAPSLA